MPSGCALLGGFAISALISLLWQHSAEREMSASACTRSTPGSRIDDLILVKLVFFLAAWFLKINLANKDFQ